MDLLNIELSADVRVLCTETLEVLFKNDPSLLSNSRASLPSTTESPLTAPVEDSTLSTGEVKDQSPKAETTEESTLSSNSDLNKSVETNTEPETENKETEKQEENQSNGHETKENDLNLLDSVAASIDKLPLALKARLDQESSAEVVESVCKLLETIFCLHADSFIAEFIKIGGWHSFILW